MIFRDALAAETLTVKPWPMMAGISSAFPNLAPKASIGMQHTDMSSEADTIHAQFTVVNSPEPTNKYHPKYIGQNQLLFSAAIPANSTAKQALGSAMTSACFVFNLPMINDFLRLNALENRQLFAEIRGMAVAQRELEYDLLQRIAGRKSDAMKDAADWRVNAMMYMLPKGVSKLIDLIGVSVSQSNSLYSPGEPMVSLSADTGQTMITASIRGAARVKNFWGTDALFPFKFLWLMIIPVMFEGVGMEIDPLTGSPFPVPQLVPYVGNDFTNDVPASARYYKGLGGVWELAPLIPIGMIMDRYGKLNVADNIYEMACGKVPGVSLSAAFQTAELLPMLTINSNPKPFGNYVVFTN